MPESPLLKVALLTDHPSPHMVEFFNALALQNDCNVKIIYCGAHAPGRKWKSPADNLPHLFLKSVTLFGKMHFNPSIFNDINRVHADIWAINTMYTSPSTWFVIWWLNRKRIPWVYMAEPARPHNRLFLRLKYALLHFMLKQARGIIGTGNKAQEMYWPLVSRDKPVTAIPYYALSLKDFLNTPISRELNPYEDVSFLVVCQMIRRKGIDILLKACELLPKKGWHLTLVGNGPLRKKMETKFTEHFQDGRVKFIDEISYETRSSLFSKHHVFVFPSRWDGWGMVLPEAMACGLPAIVTDKVISAHDFIREGENGFIITANDCVMLADKMNWFLKNRTAIPSMGQHARQSLKDYKPETSAEKFIDFLSEINDYSKNTIATPNPPHGLYENSRNALKKFFINKNLYLKPRRKARGHRILFYHCVFKKDREQFKEHLRFLMDNFNVCSLRSLLESTKYEQEKNFCATITFDDGFKVLMEDCLELLEKIDIKASFYVTTDFVERGNGYMNVEDLKLLTKLGHEVGSHGVSHVSMSAMLPSVAMKELIISQKKITEWTKKKPEGFAYPYGEIFNSLGSPAEWVRKAGYSYAVTARRGRIDRSSDPFLLNREHFEGSLQVQYLRYFLTS